MAIDVKITFPVSHNTLKYAAAITLSLASYSYRAARRRKISGIV